MIIINDHRDVTKNHTGVRTHCQGEVFIKLMSEKIIPILSGNNHQFSLFNFL